MPKIRNFNLTKKDISKIINSKVGISRLYATKIVNDLILSLIILIKKNDLNITSFGKFKIKDKSQRIGRNPKTGEVHTISQRKSLSFTASKKISNKINKT